MNLKVKGLGEQDFSKYYFNVKEFGERHLTRFDVEDFKENYLKYFVILFCALTVICGITLLALGGNGLSDDPSSHGISITIIVLGLLLFIPAALGIWGTWKENQRILLVFAITHSVVFLVLLVVFITGAVYYNNVVGEAEEHYTSALINYYSDKLSKREWDMVQSQYQCCGLNGAEDYLTIGNIFPPASCCATSYSGFIRTPEICEEWLAQEKEGCMDIIVERQASKYEGLLATNKAGIMVSIIMLFGGISGWGLWIKNAK